MRNMVRSFDKLMFLKHFAILRKLKECLGLT